jgi:hypothetical protein
MMFDEATRRVVVRDLTGLKFDRWTVVSRAENRKRMLYWNCVCKCGNKNEVSRGDLWSGKSRSCGCIRDEVAPTNLTHPVTDFVGRRFHQLVVIGDAAPAFSPAGHKTRRLVVRCDCGTEKIVRYCALHTGDAKSCGCGKSEAVSKAQTKHGECKGNKRTPEFCAWQGMIARCTNTNLRAFKHYGGRGIDVCARWRESFDNFLADMGRRPSDVHSLDRYPDNDGNYEPSNCRWATQKEQCNNKRSPSRVKADLQAAASSG